MRYFIIFTLCLSLISCASKQTMTKAERSEVGSKGIARVVYIDSGEPNVMKPGNAMFGIVGAIAASLSSDRKKLRDALKEDPAMMVSNEFLSLLRTKRTLTSLSSSPQVTKLPPPPPMKQGYQSEIKKEEPILFNENEKSSFFLRLDSNDSWMVIYSGLGGDYHLNFRLNAALMRVKDRSSVWKGVCEYSGKEGDQSLRYSSVDSMLEDNGAGFNLMVNAATKTCASQLYDQFVSEGT